MIATILCVNKKLIQELFIFEIQLYETTCIPATILRVLSYFFCVATWLSFAHKSWLFPDPPINLRSKTSKLTMDNLASMRRAIDNFTGEEASAPRRRAGGHVSQPARAAVCHLLY